VWLTEKTKINPYLFVSPNILLQECHKAVIAAGVLHPDVAAQMVIDEVKRTTPDIL
jgi:hypothetical protein